MSDPQHPIDPLPQEPTLSPDDQAALDELVRALHRDAKPAGERAARIAGILDLAGAGTAPASDQDRAALIGLTLARLTRSSTPQQLELSPRDADAHAAWVVDGNYESSRVPGDLRARAARLDHLRDAAVSTPIEIDQTARATLINSTMFRLAQAAPAPQRGELRRSLGSLSRWANVASVAAVLLIGASVALPVLSAAGSQARRMACRSNLAGVASAFSSYAGANRDLLPHAPTSAVAEASPWWNVGHEASNSRHLYTLARAGYASLTQLACPGNARATTSIAPQAEDWACLEEVSYSYQLMRGPSRQTLATGPRRPIMADRSPVVLRAVRGEAIDPMESSPNHSRSGGQSLLFSDGSVVWTSSPLIERPTERLMTAAGIGVSHPAADNIWLPDSKLVLVEVRLSNEGLRLRGFEVPSSEFDTLLGP
jgi:hypothetical protein